MSGPEDIDNELVGFDSIEEALAARVPPKTCEHCKHWQNIWRGTSKALNGAQYKWSCDVLHELVEIPVSMCREDLDLAVPKDFGCNKWEAK
jgi:hypothetical protein